MTSFNNIFSAHDNGLQVRLFSDWSVGTANGNEFHYHTKNLKPPLEHKRGGLYCWDDRSCYAPEYNNPGENYNTKIDGDGVRNIDAVSLAPNLAFLVRGGKQGGGYHNKFGNLFRGEEVTKFDESDIANLFDMAIWAPMMEEDVVKMNCCLGKIPRHLCGDYAPDPSKVNAKCEPYLNSFCKQSKFHSEDKGHDYLDNIDFPTKKGCWVFNPMKTARGVEIKDGLPRGKWYEFKPSDGKKIMNKDNCIPDASKEVAFANLDASVKDVPADKNFRTNYPVSYYAPIVTWLDEDMVNETRTDMNDKTTNFEKTYCGCDLDVVRIAGEKQMEELKKLLEKGGHISNGGMDSIPELCRIKTCGSQFSTAIPRSSNQINPQCNSSISMNICTQDISPELQNNANIKIVTASQYCNANDKQKVTKSDSFNLPYVKTINEENLPKVIDTIGGIFGRYFKERFPFIEFKNIAAYNGVVTYTVIGASEDVEKATAKIKETGQGSFQEYLKDELEAINPNKSATNYKKIILIILGIVVALIMLIAIFVAVRRRRRVTNILPPRPTFNS